MAAFIDLGKTPRDNDLLTIFVIGFIRTFRQSSTSHVGIGSTAQKVLDDLDANDTDEDIANYCICNVDAKYMRMVVCDSEDCPHKPFEWFHVTCIKLKQEPVGKWYFGDCRERQALKNMKSGWRRKEEEKNLHCRFIIIVFWLEQYLSVLKLCFIPEVYLYISM